MKFILMVLSVYRITDMIVYETGPLGIFEKLRTFTYEKSYNHDELQESIFIDRAGFWRNIDDGINCPFCVSVWISAIVWIMRKSELFTSIFGLAGAWMILNQIMNRIQRYDN